MYRLTQRQPGVAVDEELALSLFFLPASVFSGNVVVGCNRAAAANPREKNLKSNEKTAIAWQLKILADRERIMQRKLTDVETGFVRSRDAFVALEMIEDCVSHMDAVQLTAYLNSGHCG